MFAVEEKLRQLFPDQNWVVNKVEIGASNQAFIASGSSQKVFIKIDVKSPALLRLAKLGVAPRVIYDGSKEEKSYILQEFIEGKKPDKTWYAQNVKNLAYFIKKYHQDKVLKDILEKEDKKHTYKENIELVMTTLEDDIRNSNSDLFNVSQVKVALKLLHEKSKKLKPTSLVPTHTDPNPQNFLLTKKGVVMVDWDDIFLSDPYKDIGLILWWYIPKVRWPDFFKVYGMEMDEEKLRWWITRNTLSIAGWYGKRGNSEYVKFFIDDALMALDRKNNSQIFENNTI